MKWTTLRRMYESRAAIARAVERGWVILEGTSGKPLELRAALTDEGRRLPRRGRYSPRKSIGLHGEKNHRLTVPRNLDRASREFSVTCLITPG